MTPEYFLNALFAHNYEFVTGVPDSLFKDLISLFVNDKRFQHVICNNEGEACALAAGYHLGSGKIPVVYMQNSGLGNCINPLTSLLDELIYAIPSLLLIGWRGHPEEVDEPQHRRMGTILLNLLTLLNIPYVIVGPQAESLMSVFKEAKRHFAAENSPFALIFTRHVFSDSPLEIARDAGGLIREELLKYLVQHSLPEDIFVTTTGKTSRELYAIRERFESSHASDFLTVGSMGCASSIALGIAMQQLLKRIIVLDGDGACLMRLEAMVTIGHVKPCNFLHIIFDNNAYESTGAQQTLSHQIDLATIARNVGYTYTAVVDTLADFILQISDLNQGLKLLVVKVAPYSNPTIGRPKTSSLENKEIFMQHLGINLCKL